MIPSFVLRSARRDRFTYLLAASLARAGAEVLVSLTRARWPEPPSNDATFCDYLHEEPDVVLVEESADVSRGRVLLDQRIEAEPWNGQWDDVIGVRLSGRSDPAPYDGCAKYLVIGDRRREVDEARRHGVRIVLCPLWPHPRVFRDGERLAPANGGPRRVRALVAAAPKPAARVRLIRQLRDRLGPEAWVIETPMTAAEISSRDPSCVIGEQHVCPYEEWPALLAATRWCVDLPGDRLFTHRIIEACMSGCAIVLDARSAAAYDPPFVDGVDCLTYRDDDFADVVVRALAMPEEQRLRLAVAAQSRYGRSAGGAAVLGAVLKLLQD